MIRFTITLFLTVFALMCEAQTFEYNGGTYQPAEDTEFGKSACLVAFQGAIPENGELILDSVVFKDGEEGGFHVTAIGEGVFVDLENLKSIIFPEYLLEIGNHNFVGMASLEKVEFGNHLRYMGDSNFMTVPKLKEISFPNSLEMIWEFSFLRVGLTHLIVSGGAYPCHKTFCELNDLEYLEFVGEGRIGDDCFTDLPKIKRVSFPKECSGIDDGSFENLAALEEIVFPDRADFAIASNIFQTCPAVKRIYANCMTPPVLIDNAILSDPYNDETRCLDFKNITLYVPFGAKETYENNPLWNVYGSIREFNPAGIHAAETSGPDSFVRSVAGGIVIDNPRGETVTVSDMNGRSASYNGCSAVSLESGAYIVTLGAKSAKVIVK